MECRVTNYILAAHMNRNQISAAAYGKGIMDTLDHVVSYSGRKFDMDRLDKILCDIIASPILSESTMKDVRLAMRMYGE